MSAAYGVPYTLIGSMFPVFALEPVHEPSTYGQYYVSGGTLEHIFAGYTSGLGYGYTGVSLFGQPNPSVAEVRNPNLNALMIQDEMIINNS